MAYSDQDLLKIMKEEGKVSVPYFDGADIEVMCDLEPAVALPALKNFLQLTNDQRLKDGRHLFGYYSMMAQLTDVEVDGPVSVENIWNYARPSLIFFGQISNPKYANPETVFVQIEGNCDWEEEHGLQMSWADGAKLVKVGSFDGHPTNGHAKADIEGDKYVFDCYDKSFSTLPD